MTRPENKPAPATRKPGRPRTLQGARRTMVYLDEASIIEARRVGSGKLSAGIRKALQLTKTIKTT